MKQGWKIVKLGELTDCSRGHNPPKSKFISEPRNGYVRFYQIRDGWADDYVVYVPDTPQLHKVNEEDILMVAYRHIGKAFRGVNGAFNVALCKISNVKKDLLDNEYLFQIIQSPFVKGELLKRSERSLIPSMSVEHLKNIEIPIPPLPEQKRIVAILDEAFAAIATAKENAGKNLQNARELFESYLQSVFANPGDGWEEKRLKEIGVTQTGTTPKTSDKENYGDFIPFVKPADVDISGNGEIRYSDEGLTAQGLKNGRKMSKGSILMVCIGATIGKVGFVDRDVSCNQQINSLTVNKGFYPKFFYYALSTQSFFKQVIKNAAQATLPIINKGKWENLSVHYPKSIFEQCSIVAKLDALSLETKKLEAIYRQKLADLDELKKSVLQKAFNGGLA